MPRDIENCQSYVICNVIILQCRGTRQVDFPWARGTLVGVLSEAKSLNAVKGQKVAGSSPVRPTKHPTLLLFLALFNELTFENCVNSCLKWFSKVFERLNPNSRAFRLGLCQDITRHYACLTFCIRIRAIARASSM